MTKLAFAHYFSPYPLSIYNDAQPDYYTRNYLTPSGEGGKHAAYGGLLRDRPIFRSPKSGNWKLDDMVDEVERAKAAGFDGFTVDLMSTSTTGDNYQRVLNVITAAGQVGDFLILLMPDMTASVGGLSYTALANYVHTLGKYSACFRIGGQLVVSPFGVEHQPNSYWTNFKSQMTSLGDTVKLVPCPVGSATSYEPTYTGMYGWSEWGSRYPGANSTATGAGTPKQKILDMQSSGYIWMQPVSLQDTRPNQHNYREAQNTTNLRNTFDIAIAGGADWIQVPTWNDFSENAHVCPSDAYGSAYLDLISYYLEWFHTGSQPHILDDQIFITTRKQLHNTVSQYNEPSPMSVVGSTTPRDKVEALVFLTATSDVVIHVGAATTTSTGLSAGIHAVTADLAAGTISVDIKRSSVVVKTLTSDYQLITPRPPVQDLNYYPTTTLGVTTPSGGGGGGTVATIADITGAGWELNNTTGSVSGSYVELNNDSTSHTADVVYSASTIPEWDGLELTVPLYYTNYADWIDIGIIDPANTTEITDTTPGDPPFTSGFWGVRLDIYNQRYGVITDGTQTSYLSTSIAPVTTPVYFKVKFLDEGGGTWSLRVKRMDTGWSHTFTGNNTPPGVTANYFAAQQRSGGLGMTARIYNSVSYTIQRPVEGATSEIRLTSYMGLPPNWAGGGYPSEVRIKQVAGLVSPLTAPSAVFQLVPDVGYKNSNSSEDTGGGNTNPGGGGGGGFIFNLDSRGRVRQSNQLVLPTLRPGLVVQANMPAAAIRKGKPYVPALWSKNSLATTITMGSSHGRVIPDPTPTTAPLPGGVTNATYRWSVENLIAPGDNPYLISDWAPEGGSGPHWLSAGVYRPSVRQHVVFGKNNAYHTYTKSLLFHPSDVNHMWLDMGSAISEPFTWMFAGIILSYPTRTYGHYILDAGKPTPQHDLRGGRDYRAADGLSYRNLMLFQRTSAILCTRPRVEDGVYVRASHNYVPRARVMYGVFNGSSSSVGYFDHENQVMKGGKVDVKTHRYFVTGRRTNYVSDNLASHMLLFEIRFFSSALSKSHLLSNYRQMAAQWKFNHYNEI